MPNPLTHPGHEPHVVRWCDVKPLRYLSDEEIAEAFANGLRREIEEQQRLERWSR